jgi:hypothetical protein
MKSAAIKSNFFKAIFARAEENETWLAAGLDEEGRALRAARDAASQANLDALRAYRNSSRTAADQAIARAALKAMDDANWAWHNYLIQTQPARAHRARAVLGRWKKNI